MIGSNIYEYLVNMHPSVTDMLKLCRAEKRFVSEGASDFEKFRELCLNLSKLSGHPFFLDICKSTEQLFGRKIYPSRHNCEDLWRAFSGEKLIITELCETVFVRYMDTRVLHKAISLSGIKQFAKPNPYIVSQINEKYNTLGYLNETERVILTIQNIRQSAVSCMESGETLLLNASDCPLEVARDVIKYLERSGLLPTTSVIFDAEQTGNSALGELLATYEISPLICIGNNPNDIRNKIRHVAEHLPLGEVIFITDVDGHDLSASVNMLRDEWILCGLCSDSDHVKFNIEKMSK